MLSQESGKPRAPGRQVVLSVCSAPRWQVPVPPPAAQTEEKGQRPFRAKGKSFLRKRAECSSFPGFCLVPLPGKYFL